MIPSLRGALVRPTTGPAAARILMPPSGPILSQPTYAVAINKTHPLANGLFFSAYNTALEANGPTLNLCDGTRGTMNGGGNVVGDARGLVTKFNANVGITHKVKMPQRLITFAFWLYWDSFNNSDGAIAMEYTANFASNNGILVDPNVGTGNFLLAVHSPGTLPTGETAATFTRPSAAAWHHYVIICDRNAGGSPIGSNTGFYLDAVAVNLNISPSNFVASDWDDASLNIMQRQGGTLQGTGRMQNICLWSRALTIPEIKLHYANPWCYLRRAYPYEVIK